MRNADAPFLLTIWSIKNSMQKSKPRVFQTHDNEQLNDVDRTEPLVGFTNKRWGRCLNYVSEKREHTRDRSPNREKF